MVVIRKAWTIDRMQNPENRGLEMHSEKDMMAVSEDYVPLTVRKVRQMRNTLWSHLWMSFVSIVVLAAALAILSYRIGAQSCH
jgi:hypothetical protein